MNSKEIKFIGCIAVLLLVFAVQVKASDFAVEVVDYNGLAGLGLYDDPNSVLGKPTMWIYDTSPEYYGEIYACSLVYSAFSIDPNGGKLITTIENGIYIIVEFDHKIADDPGNPYGIDFIVFGNSKFEGNGYVDPNTNMEQYFLENPTSVSSEPVRVSVAQEPNGPWYSFAGGPYGDTAFPTNAFEWDRGAGNWGDELDWLKPVDPNLSDPNIFNSLSAADAIDFYDGSAGGTGFDLKSLDPNDYAALAADPNTGRKWIQYVKVDYSPGGGDAGEIDGFSDVAGGGDYRHPVGDLNVDCSVDYEDLALFCRYWLAEINKTSDPAVIADINEDGIVNFYDLASMAGNWFIYNLGCE